MKRSPGTKSRTTTMAVVAAALVFFLCEVVQVAHAFAFVPVTASFAVREMSGTRVQTRLTCQEGGGYVASEPTAALHLSVIQTVRAAGAGSTWYAFLGADTEASAAVNCPVAVTSGGTGGVSYGCYWRWNQGRWIETEDNTSLPLYISGVGATFFVGNTHLKPASSFVSVYGPTGGFPSYFNGTAKANRDKRPGQFFGKQLVAVGTSDISTWSDNDVTGGYSYAGYVYSSILNSSRWSERDREASKANFWAICQAQAPSRTMYELTNTTSGLQQNWWIIFLVVLFVLMLIGFTIVAVCQDDEDMDEPPEDAPEWAQEETQAAKRPKSFVSTRSFRGATYDDEADRSNQRERDNDDYDERRSGENRWERRGSTSDADSRNSSEEGDFRGGRRNDEHDHQPPTKSHHRQPRQAASTAGSTRHLGRQNSSASNTNQNGDSWM